MEYLIVSATRLEIAPLLTAMKLDSAAVGQITSARFGAHRIGVLITGVGMMTTAFYLGRALAGHRYDLVIQAGIAGAFERSLALEQVVEVSSQQYGDLGVANDIGLWDVFDLQLDDPARPPFQDGRLINPDSQQRADSGLLQVRGVSVNEITSTEAGVRRLVGKYDPQVEVMEGVACHYACLQAGQPYVEWRAISNYVGERDKDDWRIPGAVAALHQQLLAYLS